MPPKKLPKKTSIEEAKERLHTSKIPEQLLMREEECEYLREFICRGIQKGSESQALYISGVPGTGKTASVMQVNSCGRIMMTVCAFQVVNSLRTGKKKNVPEFVFISVNGLDITVNFIHTSCE